MKINLITRRSENFFEMLFTCMNPLLTVRSGFCFGHKKLKLWIGLIEILESINPPKINLL